MLNYTTANLVSVPPPVQRTPAIKIGNIVILMNTTLKEGSGQSPLQPESSTPEFPQTLLISNDSTYSGNYTTTGNIFNGAPVYELTQ